MINNLRRWLPCLFFLACAPAFAQNFIQPTPEELSMTAEPAAPDAPAIYLFRDERADDRLHMHSLYVRMKILTEAGKRYADVEIPPYEGRSFSIHSVEGRTIHSDGTSIPFTGKPYEKMLEKTKTLQVKTKVFTLPDVQVGSILEYRYVLAYDDGLVVVPEWYIQQSLYVRKAHYMFVPSDRGVIDEHGNVTENSIAYTPALPKGVEVKESVAPSARVGVQGRSYSLDIEKVAAVPEDEFMPPMRSFSYRVLFYYSTVRTADEYWKLEGKYWSKDVDRFANPGKLGGAVGTIVAASDTPTQKAQKIYDAVMQLENTSFTRGHSGAEDKAAGIKIKTAEDIWGVKRGNASELTLLYVGLARAAGLQAYAAQVTDRNEAFFVPGFLSMRQLDDYLAIVVLDGKEQYLDPGERYCPFGVLHWKHTMTGGLRQSDHGAEVVQTPSLGYKEATMLRVADLDLESDGKVHGTLRITMTGNRALYWRQRALYTDEAELKKEFENSLQGDVPAGVEVKTNHFLALTEYDKGLMAIMDATGSMGTGTSKRIFLPATFFEAGTKPLFVHDKRTVPVDLDYPYQVQDSVTIHLPKSLGLESAPKDAQIPLPKNALYQVVFKQKPDSLTSGRQFILANALYSVEEYPALKEFYQKVNAKDQEQAVLQPAPATPAAGAAAPGGAQ